MLLGYQDNVVMWYILNSAWSMAKCASYESPCELATLATSSSMDSSLSGSGRLSLSLCCSLATVNLDSAPPPPPPLPAPPPASPAFRLAAHSWAF